MTTNVLSPMGLVLSRNLISGSNTYQGNFEAIKNGYGSNIGLGDLVVRQVGASQGYVGLAATTDTAILGVFAGVNPAGYYDQNLQQTAYGRNGAYISTAAPPSGVNIPCLVISDPFVTFRAQVSGGPGSQSWIGQNINFTSGTNGVPNIAGISTLSLDASSISTDPNLPFRIVGFVGTTGGPMDPTATNPWVEVRLNTAEMLSSAGA